MSNTNVQPDYPSYTIGLDIAEHGSDHAALAIVERWERRTPPPPFSGRDLDNDYDTVDHYRVVYLKQWPSHTAKGAVIADIADMCHLFRHNLRDARIIYDATGLGASWSELIRQRHMAGNFTHWHPWALMVQGEQVPDKFLHVQKSTLMSRYQRLMAEGRFEVCPRDLYLADQLKKQSAAINLHTLPSGRSKFGAPQSVHDDLPAAVSFCLGSNKPSFYRHAAPARFTGTERLPDIDPLRLVSNAA